MATNQCRLSAFASRHELDLFIGLVRTISPTGRDQTRSDRPRSSAVFLTFSCLCTPLYSMFALSRSRGPPFFTLNFRHFMIRAPLLRHRRQNCRRQPSSDPCLLVAFQVAYTIAYDGIGSIVSVNADLVFTNTTADASTGLAALQQSFSVNWVRQGTQTKVRPKSGNPGYLDGKRHFFCAVLSTLASAAWALRPFLIKMRRKFEVSEKGVLAIDYVFSQGEQNRLYPF